MSNSELYENILNSLGALQKQNRQLLGYQEKSYKWHLQHNENVKNLVSNLNDLHRYVNEKKSRNELIRKRPKVEKMEIENDTRQVGKSSSSSSSSSSTITPSTPIRNLHEEIMHYARQMNVLQMENVLLRMDDANRLNELKEESMDEIIPIIGSFLGAKYDDDRRGFALGYLITIVSSKICLNCFKKSKHRKNVEIVMQGLKDIAYEMDSFDVSETELKNIYRFLSGCKKQ